MKTKRLTITFLLAFLVLGNYNCTTVNDSEKEEMVDFLKKNILGKSEEVITSAKPLNMVLLADGTGSRYTRYAIPELDTAFIGKLIRQMHKNDGGKIWLAYIDNNSRNNPNQYLSVLPAANHPRPVRRSGETSFAFSNRQKEWEQQHQVFSSDSLVIEEKFQKGIDQFLLENEALLKRIYTRGTIENQWTDAIGSLNSAITSLEQLEPEAGRKIIICFSDLEQDAPYLKPKPELRNIPSDITIIMMNPALGSSNKVTNQVIEVEHPSRVFELCFPKPK